MTRAAGYQGVELMEVSVETVLAGERMEHSRLEGRREIGLSVAECEL